MSFMPDPGQWVVLTDGRTAKVTHVTPDGSDDRAVFPDGHEERITVSQIHAVTDEEIDGFVDGTAADSPPVSAEDFIRVKEAEYDRHMATGCGCGTTLAEYLGMTPEELAAWHDHAGVPDRVRRSWGLPPASPGSAKAFFRAGRGSLRGQLVMEPGADIVNDSGSTEWEEAAACPSCAVEAAPRGWRKLLVPAGRALAWFFYYGDHWLDRVPGFNAEYERLYDKHVDREYAKIRKDES